MLRESRAETVPLSASLWSVVRAVTVALAVTGLAACSSNPIPTFDLSAPSQFTAKGGGTGQLVVVMPTALAALDTEKILVEPAPGQISYLSDAQWADRLPPLLQARTIQAFENGSRLARVARPGDGVSGDYQLNMDIRTFGVRVEPSGAQAVVEISAKVIGNQAGRIVAARVFTARVPIASVTGPDVARALDEASDQVLIEMVRWAAPRF